MTRTTWHDQADVVVLMFSTDKDARLLSRRETNPQDCLRGAVWTESLDDRWWRPCSAITSGIDTRRTSTVPGPGLRVTPRRRIPRRRSSWLTNYPDPEGLGHRLASSSRWLGQTLYCPRQLDLRVSARWYPGNAPRPVEFHLVSFSARPSASLYREGRGTRF